jgi:hypothetical protein
MKGQPMRNITEKVVKAFVNGNKAKIKNTESTGTELILFGHVIAKKENGKILASLRGYNTSTTRERLNGLCRILGVNHGYNQKDFGAYFDGQAIDSTSWQVLKG